MITWNIDLTNYTEQELEDLLAVVEKMDTSIANKLVDYLKETFNT